MIDQSVTLMIVDVLFVALVMAACFYNMTRGSEAYGQQIIKWREELGALRLDLKDLIEHAGEASSNLDRRLIRRKEELECLLKDLSKKEDEVSRLLNGEKKPINSLPNHTWLDKDLELAQENPSEDGGSAYDIWQDEPAQITTAHFDLPSSLELDAEEQSEANYAHELPPRKNISRRNTLAEPIDVDTYRVAKRLFAAGHSPEVIARKMQLSKAKVEMLAKIINGEEQATEKEKQIADARSSQVKPHHKRIVNGQLS